MSFNPNSGLRVFGLVEALRGLDDKIRRSPMVRRDILMETSQLFASDARANAHVISGKTKASIRVDSVTDRVATISAGFGMPFEERRAGTKEGTPHTTFTETAKRVNMQMPRIIRRHYDRIATGTSPI